MRLPLTFRNFIADLKLEPHDAFDIRRHGAAKLDAEPTPPAAEGGTIGAKVPPRHADIRRGVGDEQVGDKVDAPTMNLLHRLKIAELDDPLIGGKLRKSFQRLSAA